MANEKGNIPAWIVAVDLLNKLKRELVTQAMETLDAEIEAKRIDIKGSLVTQPDQHSDTEMKLFVIGKILSNSDQMREKYESYLKHVGEKGPMASASEIETADRARLFLMAIEKIEVLVGYSNMIDSWITEASMLVGKNDVALIIKETCKGEHRRDVLSFILRSKKIEDEGIITDSERKLIELALAK